MWINYDCLCCLFKQVTCRRVILKFNVFCRICLKTANELKFSCRLGTFIVFCQLLLDQTRPNLIIISHQVNRQYLIQLCNEQTKIKCVHLYAGQILYLFSAHLLTNMFTYAKGSIKDNLLIRTKGKRNNAPSCNNGD